MVAGDADQVVWTDLHSRSFARDVPGAELILMPGIGHMPQYADRETVLPPSMLWPGGSEHVDSLALAGKR